MHSNRVRESTKHSLIYFSCSIFYLLHAPSEIVSYPGTGVLKDFEMNNSILFLVASTNGLVRRIVVLNILVTTDWQTTIEAPKSSTLIFV